MKKKILVPIMALAMLVAAGVNCKIINESINSTGLSLQRLVS